MLKQRGVVHILSVCIIAVHYFKNILVEGLNSDLKLRHAPLIIAVHYVKDILVLNDSLPILLLFFVEQLTN